MPENRQLSSSDGLPTFVILLDFNQPLQEKDERKYTGSH